MRKKTEMENGLIRDGVYALVANPKEVNVIPEVQDDVPYFNFAPLENAIRELKEQAAAFDKIYKSMELSSKSSAALNQVLKDMERSLTKDHGLPRRPWFKHHVYAPGFYTGYGVKTLPGVREAIEQRDYEEVSRQVEILSDVLLAFSTKIEEAVSIME